MEKPEGLAVSSLTVSEAEQAAQTGAGESLDYHTVYNRPHKWRQKHATPVLIFR